MLKNRKPLAVFLALILTVSCFATFAYASSPSEKLKDVNDQLNNSKQELEKGKEQQNALIAQIDEINGQIEGIENDIASLDSEIETKLQQIEVKKGELEQTQTELNVQNESLSNRLRVMYKNGETGIIEVIIRSSDIIDLIANIHMVQLLYDHDKEVLDEIEEKYDQIRAEKKELENMESDLEYTKDQKEVQAEELNKKVAEVEAVEEKVASDNAALEAQIDELERQAQAITAELQKGTIKTTSSHTSTYSGGVLLWPVPEYARLSSPFGYRVHPILKTTKFHSGIDIAAASGKQILAANGGTVVFSGTKSGYGKTIMIDHGGGVVTLYGHCSSLIAGVGQSVARGEVVALVGSTGQSTGPHCHFEVRVDGTPRDPMAYLQG